MGTANEKLQNLIEENSNKAVRPYRADGYYNMLNKYGTKRDVTEHYKYKGEDFPDDSVLTTYYESNGLFAKIIDTPAEEALKNGFELEGITNKKVIDFYKESLDELDWEDVAVTAVKWARLYGGAVAVMLIDDGNDDLSKPLDWKNIKSIDDIRVYDRSLVQPDYTSMFNYSQQDPFRTQGSRLGMPEFYDITSRYGTFRVHDSRCLVFRNGTLPENATNGIYQMWGMPEYVRVNKAIRDAEIASGSAVKMLDRSVQPVYKMKDLALELATEQGEDRVLQRLETIDMSRGMLNTVVVDNDGEDFDFRTFQFSGVAQVVDSTCNYLSAITSIPQTVLFGRSPAGMNSTGDGDLENWYNYVERIQRRMIRSNLRYLLSVIFQAGLATGEIEQIPKIKIAFNPLWSLTEEQTLNADLLRANIQKVHADTAILYANLGAVDNYEVRQALAASEALDVEAILNNYTKEQLFPEGKPPFKPMTEMGGGASTMTGGEEGGLPGEAGIDAPVAEEEPQGGEGSTPANAPEATKQTEEEQNEDALIEDDVTKPSLRTEEKISDDHAKPNGSVGVLVVKRGKILTGTRHAGDGRGLIGGPGGMIENGESPREAAYRETEEEFNIRPLELIYLGRGEQEPNGNAPYIYLCTKFEGKPQCVAGNGVLEMSAAQFLNQKQLAYLGQDKMFRPFAYSIGVLNGKLLNKRFNGLKQKPNGKYRLDK